MMNTRSAWFSGAVVLAIACGSRGGLEADPASGSLEDGGPVGSLADATAQGGGSAIGRACAVDGDCGPNGVCDPAGKICACGGVAVDTAKIPANVLLVLDRSCSMTDPVAKKGPMKWTVAVNAIHALTQAFAGRIRFGLTLFPDESGDNCTEGAIPVPVGDGNEPKIQSLLQGALDSKSPLYPNGPCVTPIDTAALQASTEPAFDDKTRQSFVVLITDGEQAGCTAGGGNMGTEKTLGGLAKRGVRTFVIGFGGAVDVTSLDAFAEAGAEVNAAGPHKFFEAQDESALDAELTSIGQTALSCDLALASAPPGDDPDLVFVYFDHALPAVPRDPAHANGWDYEPAAHSVHFYGDACDRIKAGAVKAENVVFGCPGAPPPLLR
jgi:hypothetical protein